MNNLTYDANGIAFANIKSRLTLLLVLLVLLLSACSQKSNQGTVSNETLSAPLPEALLTAAVVFDETNLLVELQVDGGEPQACNNLQINLSAGTFSCDLVLSTGPHTLSLLHSVIDDLYGKVQLAMVSGIEVNIMGGQSTPADFNTAVRAYTDDDGDGISNIVELEFGSNPNKMDPPPTFTSPVMFTINENNRQVATVQATDVDARTIRYSIAGGDDQGHFNLNVDTGELAFVDAPDFENPTDTDKNNMYTVLVSASTDLINTEQTVEITVTDVGVTGTLLLQVSADAKQLNFSWNAVNEATHYRLLENPDGASGFTQISADLSIRQYTQEIAVHRLDWFNASYIVDACDANGCISATPLSVGGVMLDAIVYGKASNTGENDLFGTSVALSGDGNTLAVGAYIEASNAIGINSATGQSDNSASNSGAVYVFQRNTGKWQQQAYIKASNTGAGDFFGFSLALSSDGNTLAVGAGSESSNAIGINPATGQSDNSASNSGAVYVFQRNTGKWQQQTYVKASNTGADDQFGFSVALSGDGNTLAVGAYAEDSNAIGIPIPPAGQSDNSAGVSGAVYVFQRNTGKWQQQAYVKASNTGAGDRFGASVALSGDGNTLAVGTYIEASNAIGINPATGQSDNSASNSGAVYVFQRNTGKWQQQAYVKASNTGENDLFGFSLALSGDGNTLAVGAYGEASNAIGIPIPPAGQSDNSVGVSGAVYVFQRNTGKWRQQVYVKASNTGAGDRFGISVALSGDGNTLAVGAGSESSNAIGINPATGQSDNSTSQSGAVYLY